MGFSALLHAAQRAIRKPAQGKRGHESRPGYRARKQVQALKGRQQPMGGGTVLVSPRWGLCLLWIMHPGRWPGLACVRAFGPADDAERR